MKKTIKLLICLSVILGILVAYFSFGTFAAQALLSFDKSSYNLGQTVTMTIKYNANAPIYANEIDVTYNNSVLRVASVNGGEYTLGTSTIKIVDDDLSTATAVHTSGTYVVTFTTVAVGDANVSVSVISDGGSASASGNINVALSSNANLASLKVSGAILSPAFNPNTTSYSATVKYSVDKTTVSAGVADGNATLVGAGTYDLAVGDNLKTITVTAASGAKKSYTVNIKRLSEEETAALEEQERADDVFLVVYNGKDYHIMQDISELEVPGGFTASTILHRENEIGVLVDTAGEYTLYYLTADDDETQTPVVFYKTENEEFKELPYIISSGNLYIIEPPVVNFIVNEEKYLSNSIDLGSQKIDTYSFTDARLSDFYIVYAYFNGERSFYRYDTVTEVLQRAPDFVEIVVEEETEKANIFADFSGLSTAAKIVILLVIISVLAIIALIVLLIIRMTSYRKELPEEDEVVAFDEVCESDGIDGSVDLETITDLEDEEEKF